MIRDQLAGALAAALEGIGVPAPASVGLEQPARREHGDWSSNVAMATAKAAGRNPRELAAQLVEVLSVDPPPHVTAVEVAGPGFVNFRLAPTWLHDVLVDVVEQGDAGYGRSDLGAGTKVMVEFVSANPTGPLHAGHARGAVYGDALARILQRAGHTVAREFYINDRGVQMAKFGASIAARAAGDAAPEDGYRGAYVADWAADLPDGADPTEHGYARALTDQREVLAALGVEFDVWFSERSMVGDGAIDRTLQDLRDHGAVEDRDGATWLRASQFGANEDRVLVKSDGEPSYLLPDLAYHRDKLLRGFDLLIDVWGADHHDHVQRVRAGLVALGYDAAQFEVAIIQLVRLVRDGVEVKISKRTGDLIELRDLIDEVGADATRFTYLLQSVDSKQTVDLGLIVSETMENPVFYVQMAHARLCSIDRKAADAGVARVALADADLGLLVHDREAEVLRALFALPTTIELAARERAPHKVTTWLRELAGAVHGFYHDCPILRSDVPDDLRQARLWLSTAAGIGLRVGLDVLGVGAPESMGERDDVLDAP
jgi:arginyl-tRNA synthetase